MRLPFVVAFAWAIAVCLGYAHRRSADPSEQRSGTAQPSGGADRDGKGNGMERENKARSRAAALLKTAGAGERVTPAEALLPPSELGAKDGFAYSWDNGRALSSVYVFDSYGSAIEGESLAIKKGGRTTVNGALMLWVTGDDALAAELIESFAGEE